jgi:hypothetical protein
MLLIAPAGREPMSAKDDAVPPTHKGPRYKAICCTRLCSDCFLLYALTGRGRMGAYDDVPPVYGGGYSRGLPSRDMYAREYFSYTLTSRDMYAREFFSYTG